MSMADANRGPLTSRLQDFEAAQRGVDVVIVGGGITGAGAARDAVMRGLKVAIVEMGDWGSGATSIATAPVRERRIRTRLSCWTRKVAA